MLADAATYTQIMAIGVPVVTGLAGAVGVLFKMQVSRHTDQIHEINAKLEISEKKHRACERDRIKLNRSVGMMAGILKSNKLLSDEDYEYLVDGYEQDQESE